MEFTCERSHRPDVGFELSHRPDAIQAVTNENLVSAKQLSERDITDLGLNSCDLGPLKELRTHYASYTASLDRRGQQYPRLDHEEVAEDRLDDTPGSIAHQPFGKVGILPFGTRQYLFQAIEVFQPGQSRLLGETGRTGIQAHAFFGMFGRVTWQWRSHQNDSRLAGSWRAVAAPTVATRQDQFGYASTKRLAKRDNLRTESCHVAVDSEALATKTKTIQMTIQQLRLTIDNPYGFEQTVAVRKTSIMEGQPIGGLPIHPAQCHSVNRRKTSEPLVPPKPKELETATSIVLGFASCGTKSKSQPSSGSSRLMVGGAT